jgi:ADP-dependent NAD(P)H-hydrate dehydratase / NAD(P)H-hydrate epimerase
MSSLKPSDSFMEPSPNTWTKAVWDRELARLVDEASSKIFHIDASALMETAGRAVAAICIERGLEKHGMIVLCGRGNNGGDGLVAARVLHDHGAQVTIVIIEDPERNPSALFTKQHQTALAMGIPMTTWQPGTIPSLGVTRPIIIDAISGIGFKSPCSGVMLEALTEAAKIKDAMIIAVDLPSGLSPDDGQVAVAPLTAHETVTFGSSRPVHRLMPAAACCGNLTVADIGFPKAAVLEALEQKPAIWREVDPQAALHIDPWASLPKIAHKYDRGHVLVIGGSSGKIGAPILTALAALKTGAGWCSLAVPRGETPVDMMIPPELTVESFFDGSKIDTGKLAQFLIDRHVKTVVVGPGWMGQCLDAQSLACLRTFGSAGGTVILDAGALHGVAPLILKGGPLPRGAFILTPHHGEWQKIQELPPPTPLTPHGVAAASKFAATLGAHILYKNAAPVVVSPEAVAPIICISGIVALARAGSGDLLAGIMAAHLALGCSQDLAAARGYTLLARAAWMAAQDVGDDGVLASDIIARLGIAARM